MSELSVERAIEALYTVRAYYASLTAGYPKGKDRRGIGDVMCSEIANSCLMAIKSLEDKGYEQGYEEGYEEGLDTGFERGRINGYNVAMSDIYERGESE